MNAFKFWSIGQGLFYTGSILNGDFNFVYDCGSNDINYINNHVNEYLDNFNPSKTIDFVIISHLHFDHFSGLYNLSQKAKIKKLYLPYLGDNKDLKTLILANAVYGETTTATDESLNMIFRYMLFLYGIGNGENYDFRRGEIYFASENTICRDMNSYWQFKVVNKKISDTKYVDLCKKISKLLSNEKASDILEILHRSKGADKIKKAYCEVFKTNQNPTSIILIHNPLFKSITFFSGRNKCADIHLIHHMFYHYNLPCLSIFHNNYTRKNITMLTGDASFDNSIISSINGHINNAELFVVQIPHHGAKIEWNRFDKAGYTPEQYVVSFCLGNRYHHPHKETVDNILASNIVLNCVTQAEDYIYLID